MEKEKWSEPPDSELKDSLVQKDIESESRVVVANTAAAIIVNKQFDWSLYGLQSKKIKIKNKSAI